SRPGLEPNEHGRRRVKIAGALTADRMTVCAIRCAIAWSFRCLGFALALTVSFALIQGYERAPDAFWAVFPLGPAEIGGVAFGTFGICELLGDCCPRPSPMGRCHASATAAEVQTQRGSAQRDEDAAI